MNLSTESTALSDTIAANPSSLTATTPHDFPEQIFEVVVES
jgi:hypothetical protein